MQNGLCVCKDINSLMVSLGYHHEPQEWRLFIDASKFSLKGVFLHNGNKMPSIPVAHTVEMKETYQNMATILNAIQYEKYLWNVCCDLKVVALLLGLQVGFTKYCCFLCLWDSQDTRNHYERRDWPKREKCEKWSIE